jgi:DegV family protein with EDD domain
MITAHPWHSGKIRAVNVYVVADSTTSLPAALTGGLPLLIAPLEVHHAGRVYADGVDLPPARFYELLAQPGPPPTTSSPQPGAFLKCFTEAAAAGAGAVVCLTLSADLSATHTAACVAQEEARASLPGLPITVVDTRSAATAEGLIALAAARLAATGADADAVLAEVARRMADTRLFGYLESLEHLRRGGRVPRVAAWMGRLLDIKPILSLEGGRIGMVERPRSTRRAMERLVALTENRLAGQPGRLAVMHAAAPDRASQLAALLTARLAPSELFITEFTPVIGAHTGPGLVGVALQPAA